MSIAAGNLQRENTPGLSIVFGLLVIALVVTLVNFVIQVQLATSDSRAIAEATALQLYSQQIAKHATDAANGLEDAFEDLDARRRQIADSLRRLKEGDAEAGIELPHPSLNETLNTLSETWATMSTAASSIVENAELVAELQEARSQFATRMPVLGAKMDEVVQVMVRGNAPALQVYNASRQLVLADRMQRRVNEILQGGEEAVTAADGFSRDASIFGRVLNGLLSGNDEMGIRPIDNPQALQLLGEVFNIFEEANSDVEQILGSSQNLFEIKQNSDVIFEDSQTLLEGAALLQTLIEDLPEERVFPSNLVGIGAAIVALLALIGLFFLLIRGERSRSVATSELNQRNQEAILRLLDEMGSLAEGDLTVKATVTEDITGAIADSINFAVEALRSLVTTINETAVQVAAAAQETQATAMHLAEASEHQAQQITSASAAINEIAVSIDEVSRNSAESADVAQRSVQLATRGAEVVRETIRGMDNIREQIQETSKRIKRLGESSQEIGDIVELINDIAEQTNILALNAAIQAASAGEAGRGFAVVADEVQRLAERASNATKRIETLVQTIQADTNEAVISMEQTTTEVVKGAKRAEDAGLALTEIEKVSNDLAELIQNISEAARQQSAAATNISGTMNVIQEITTQTSAGTSQTAESIGILADLARDLRKSVADFKLPA